MKNLIVATLISAAGLLTLGAGQAQANTTVYGVIENDFAILNKDGVDFAVSSAGIGVSKVINNKAIIFGEITTGAAYTSDEANHIVKGEVGLSAYLDGNATLELEVSNTYDTETGANIVLGETKLRFAL